MADIKKAAKSAEEAKKKGQSRHRRAQRIRR